MDSPAYFIPKLKSFVEYYSEDGFVYFFARPGLSIQIEDKTEFIYNVCRLMDGKRSFIEIVNLIREMYPNEVSYINSLMIALDKEYLLEDYSYNVSNSLNNYDIVRWSRNIEFFGSYCQANENKYEYQEKIKDISISVLGLGGGGSHLLYDLTALGVHKICAADFDVVELSNLNRQILYNPGDMGKKKTEIAKEKILKFLPEATLNFHEKLISSKEDVLEVVRGTDIIISLIDKPREKVIDWVNFAAVNLGIPFMSGSFDNRSAIYYTIYPGRTGCVECWKMSSRKNSPLLQDIIKKESFIKSEQSNVTIVSLVAILTGLILNDFVKLVTGIGEPFSLGRLAAFDFCSGKILEVESWQKQKDCTICGRK